MTSNILYNADPDTNCFTQLKQASIGTSEYYTENEFKSSVEHQNMNSDFSIIHFNVRSLKANYDTLSLCLTKLDFSFKAIGLTETWLNEANADLYTLNNYNHIYRYREGQVGGGVSLYLNSNLVYKERRDIENYFVSSAEAVFVETKQYIIACIYRPPSSSLSEFNTDLAKVLDIISKEGKNCYLMGDLNINIANMNNNLNKDFIDTMYSYYFHPMISVPTRVTETSATLIDNIFTNVFGDNSKSGVLCMEVADHCPIFLVTFKEHMESISTLNPKYKRSFNEANTSKFKSVISEYTWTDILHSVDPQESYTLFLKCVSQAYDLCFPLRLVSSKPHHNPTKPWITSAILKSVNTKHRLYKKYLLSPTPFNHAQLKMYRNKLNHIIRGAKKHYYNEELSKHKNNMTLLWRSINCILNKKNKCKQLPKEFKADGEVISAPQVIANTFNIFFSEVGPNLASKIPPSNHNPLQFMNSPILENMHFPMVSEDEVLKTLNGLKSSSPGYDNIDCKLLKTIHEYIVQPLTHIFNLSLEQGIVPSELKIAKIIPIHKDDDPAIFNHYRPISILPAISKILEKLLYQRLIEHLDKHNILYTHQYGFRKKHAIYLPLIHLVNAIYKARDRMENSIGIFLDLSKAFDTVNHLILLQKLAHIGVNNNALLWFKSYLKDRQQFVCYNGTNSPPLHMQCGVPQGSMLGPLLFLIYINDLSNVSDKLSTILFVDDTSVLYSHKDPDTVIKVLNEELGKLSIWFQSNKLSLNIKKTNFICFGLKPHIFNKSSQLLIDNIPITNVCSTQFLGIMVDESLSWKSHIISISSKIAKSIGILRKIRHLISSEVATLLYYSMIYPYINYCNIVWASTHQTKLEPLYRLQKRAVRTICCVHPRHSSQPLFSRIGVLSVYQVNHLQIGLFVHGSLEKTLPTFFHNLFGYNSQNHNYLTRSSNLLRPPKARTSQTQLIIGFRVSKIWNALPVGLHLSELSVYQFKNGLKTLLLNTNFPYGLSI